MHVYIIGSGIIGLSVAEYFSRKHINTTVISNNHPLAGSYAAAANLSTKGQMFARDSHFEIKLQAKKIYPTWLESLTPSTKDFFKSGKSIDIFCNKEDRDRHLKRVLQNKDELLARKLPIDSIESHGENAIIYKEEAWIDALWLINILKNVLKKRGVRFVQQEFSRHNLQEICIRDEKKLIVFCTGAWTKQLLIDLNLKLPEGFLRQERLTIGSTFVSEKPYNDKEYIMLEKFSEELKSKVTLSGNGMNQFISSSSIKIDGRHPAASPLARPRDPWILAWTPRSSRGVTWDFESPLALKEKNASLLELAGENQEITSLKEKTGVRVGYGHSEILIESVNLGSKNSQGVVCCGAHKSGFLFAPLLGEKVALLQSFFLNS